MSAIKKTILIILLCWAGLFSQETSSRVNIEWEHLKHAWRAQWITHPTANQLDFGVFFLRKVFELDEIPDAFRIHLFADNCYKLYVNGHYVCNGPSRDDLLHWRYETVDIAPYLRAGKNVIAAQVFNFGAYRPVAQFSWRTAFILQAEEIFRAFSKSDQADRYAQQCRSIRDAVYKNCVDAGRGLLADTPEKINFSQHANILAVLTNTIPQQDQEQVMRRVLDDPGLTQCTLYFRFYLFRALQKVGLGNVYLDQLGPWKEALDYGLTTFPENPIGNESVVGTRSDCHARSASPNYDLLTTVCGNRPAEPGFKSAVIEPNLGELTWVKASMPHPKGEITIELKRHGSHGIRGAIQLPPNSVGYFEWQDQRDKLRTGINDIQR